jgi:DNA-3-methyladenine glycosylase
LVTPLPRVFYDRDTLVVARDLLGKMIVRRLATGETLCGVIIETEGYVTGDPASHAFRGETPRNRAMFGPPGHAYVYFTYGVHMMLNIVTERAGLGEAVLIRALQPIEGIDTMCRHRGGRSDVRQLTNGPGKLAQAFGITRGTDDGKDVTDPMSDLIVTSHEGRTFEIVATTRIGLSRGVESPWRYYIRDNPFVSRR